MTDIHIEVTVGLTNKRRKKKMFVKKSMYIMLCLFLGGLGIHKFYAGKWFTGLLYVAFCWTWIPAILALFDLLGAMFKRTNEHGEFWV